MITIIKTSEFFKVNGCDIEEESIEENHHVFLESFTRFPFSSGKSHLNFSNISFAKKELKLFN